MPLCAGGVGRETGSSPRGLSDLSSRKEREKRVSFISPLVSLGGNLCVVRARLIGYGGLLLWRKQRVSIGLFFELSVHGLLFGSVFC